jgi:hypothetical protein
MEIDDSVMVVGSFHWYTENLWQCKQKWNLVQVAGMIEMNTQYRQLKVREATGR